VHLKLGTGTERPVTLHAGKILLDAANTPLLVSLVPGLVHIASDVAPRERIRSLLTIIEVEARQPGAASNFIIERLIELVLVEILRTKPLAGDDGLTGLLAGLADPVTERALVAVHRDRDVAHDWTVDELARLCAMSRSTFVVRFHVVLGITPIAYLLNWRIALAKDHLTEGGKSLSEIAFSVGFQSFSAFSTAFSRTVGRSPRRFAYEAQEDVN